MGPFQSPEGQHTAKRQPPKDRTNAGILIVDIVVVVVVVVVVVTVAWIGQKKRLPCHRLRQWRRQRQRRRVDDCTAGRADAALAARPSAGGGAAA